MGHVFLSYAREDRGKASALAAALEQRGVRVWFDDRLVPGAHFDFAIEEALAEATTVVVAWSRSSCGSRWVRAEAGDGLERGILVPVLIEDTAIPLEFRRIQTVDLRQWDGSEESEDFKQLVKAVRTINSKHGKPPPTNAESRSVLDERQLGEDRSRPASLASAAERGLIDLAVAKNVAFYAQAWARMDRTDSRLSWNWAAFFSGMFAGGVWPAYRKMWGLASAMFLLHFVVGVTKPTFEMPKVDLALAMAIWLVPAVFLGAYGNAIYRWHIDTLIAQARYSAAPRDELARRGGVSWIGMALFGLAEIGQTALHFYGWLPS